MNMSKEQFKKFSEEMKKNKEDGGEYLGTNCIQIGGDDGVILNVSLYDNPKNDSELRECNNCKNLNNIDAKYCSKCGDSLISEIVKTVKYCDVCLTEYNESDLYCEIDGAKLITKQMEVNPQLSPIQVPESTPEPRQDETETRYPTGLPKSTGLNPKILSGPGSSQNLGRMIQCKQCGTGNNWIARQSNGNTCYKCGAILQGVATNTSTTMIANTNTEAETGTAQVAKKISKMSIFLAFIPSVILWMIIWIPILAIVDTFTTPPQWTVMPAVILMFGLFLKIWFKIASKI